MRLYKVNNNDLDYKESVNIPSWVVHSHDQLIKVINNNTSIFPCNFARTSYTQNALFYTYIKSRELKSPLDFLFTLSEYISISKQIELLTALVVFVKTNKQNQALDYYEKCFWDLLQFIHDSDTVPWLKDIPKDPENKKWIYCYNGVPLFINGHSSAYKLRKTRFAPCDLMLVIQPYENLKKLKSDVMRIQIISDKIRKLVLNYDEMPISKVFGENFADSEVFNWKQFWLTDDDNEKPQKNCKLRIK